MALTGDWGMAGHLHRRCRLEESRVELDYPTINSAMQTQQQAGFKWGEKDGLDLFMSSNEQGSVPLNNETCVWVKHSDDVM